VSASLDGATYVQATRVSMNGYRLTAWFPPTEIKYVSLAITPAAPDTLGGTSYTFGLTDFLGSETEFQLMSDLVTLPISFAPAGVSLLLAAPADPGLLYFLNFNNTLWQEYPAGAVVSIPGATGLTQANVTIGTGGLLNITLPANTYLRSIKVTDQATGKPVALAPGLLPTDSRVSALTNGYVAVTPGGSAPALYYVSSTLSADMGKTFTVSYAAGPSTMSVQLKVQFLTSDRTETPTFTGASLQEF
jgi:hypothetical protein